MRLLATLLAVLAVTGCKTTDPLADDIQRSDVIDQGAAGTCIEDATREDAPELTERPITDTFGLGNGITVKCHDKAVFRFSAPAHGARVALKVTGTNLSSGEVSVVVNGREAGEIGGDGERTVEIPPEMLRQGGNFLVLDNVKNPPGDESWAVSQLSLEFGE